LPSRFSKRIYKGKAFAYFILQEGPKIGIEFKIFIPQGCVLCKMFLRGKFTKKFIVLSGYSNAPNPGYGLVDTEIPVEEILVDVTGSVEYLLEHPDVTIAHASVQVYADLLTGCVYDVRIGVTVVPIGVARDVLEGKLN